LNQPFKRNIPQTGKTIYRGSGKLKVGPIVDRRR
jgi:hypothetical protein